MDTAAAATALLTSVCYWMAADCGCILSQAVKQLFVIAANGATFPDIVAGSWFTVLGMWVGCWHWPRAWGIRVEFLLAKVLVTGCCVIKMQSMQKFLPNTRA